MQDAAVGKLVHGHKLLERIGGGHYGEVWRAEYLGHEVAVKLFTGGRRVSHLRREVFAQYALGRLEGEDARWFPRIEHIDLEADPPYVRMELIQGTPLEALLASPSLSLEERLAIGERVLEALSAVHRHEFVHGDLSPLNVLVTPDRSVRLIDVGYGALFEEAGDIAISTTSEERPTGVASPLYSAPERFRSAELEGCGKPADVFSFGKLLYRLITGEQPFVIKPVSLKFRALGPRWDEFLFKCLEERPEARFPDAAAALAEYRRLYRPELAPGEYRAECPECRAAQSIPGGWAGERFGCRGCGRTLEVLFYDDASRYATTALLPDARDPVPPILFLDREADGGDRARKHCVRCGGEMRVEAKKCRHCGVWVDEQARRVIEESARTATSAAPAARRSFVMPAVAVFFAYALFWVPGAVLNWFLLEEARKVERQTGQSPPGMLGLRVLMALFVTLPLVVLGGLLVLGLVGGLLAAALA
jgi:hypothetical protein